MRLLCCLEVEGGASWPGVGLGASAAPGSRAIPRGV